MASIWDSLTFKNNPAQSSDVEPELSNVIKRIIQMSSKKGGQKDLERTTARNIQDIVNGAFRSNTPNAVNGIRYNTSTQTADNTKNKAVKRPLVYNLENLNKIPEPVVIPPINGLSNTLYSQYTNQSLVPMTKDNAYRYVGAEDSQPESIDYVNPFYVNPDSISLSKIPVPEVSFTDKSYPTLDKIFKRINNGRDLAKLGTDSIVHNPDTSMDDAYANQSNISNMSTIPTNMSTPILDITPRPSNTNANTAPTVATNATPQRNASRMQSNTVTSTVTTPVAPKASVKQSVPVEDVTLGSVINKAPLVRRNGGFDEYRRQSALAALRNAGGISPAEGVQRGIIPYEALQYI